LEYFENQIKKEFDKTDNIKKLTNSGKPERPLFILIDAKTNFLAWKIMSGSRLPQKAPEIPSEINTLWAATQIGNTEFILWRVTPPKPWENMGKIKIKSFDN